MKSRISLFNLFLTALIFVFTGCTDTINRIDETLKSGSLKTQKREQKQEQQEENNQGITPVVLTSDEIDGILFMREEEKVAHDLYVGFFDLWEHQVFFNIYTSEQEHEDAILRLMDHFNLDDPAYEESGLFVNTELQLLYDSLYNVGDDSLVAALHAGAFVEEADIIDIDSLIGLTSVKSIQTVYGNLLEGSKNHLRAFVYVLDNQGYTYFPVILDQIYFDEIIAEDPH